MGATAGLTTEELEKLTPEMLRELILRNEVGVKHETT